MSILTMTFATHEDRSGARRPQAHTGVRHTGRTLCLRRQRGNRKECDNTVSVIDTRTNKVAAKVVTCKGARGVGVTDDGSRALIANTVGSTVSVIGTGTRRVTRSIKVEKDSSASPSGVGVVETGTAPSRGNS